MILMQYAEGLSRQAIFDLFVQLMTALKYIHQSGLIHRDIKPENIFVSPTGKLKVGDFGLAKTVKVDHESSSPSFRKVRSSLDLVTPKLNQGNGLKFNLKAMHQKEGQEPANPATHKVSQRSLAGTPMYLPPEQRVMRANADILKQQRARDLDKT